MKKVTKKTREGRISLNPTQHDLTTLQEIAVAERRNVADTTRLILEDVLDGKIPVDTRDESEVKRVSAGISVDEDFKARFEQFKAEKNLSADKILHIALKNLEGRSLHLTTGAGKTLPDNLPDNLPSTVRLKDLASILSDHPSIPLVDHDFPQKAIAGQASTDEITEYLIAKHIEEARANAAKKPYTEEERDAAIRALMAKHHHDGSSHKLEIHDASQLDLDDAA